MKPKIWQRVIQFFADLLLVVLAGDLLFLYYRGGWSDSNKAILLAELIALWSIVLFGIWKAQHTVRKKE